MTAYAELNDDDLIEKYKSVSNIVSSNRNAEQAIKILLNAGYGAFTNNHFKFFDIRIGTSITLTGQCIIQWCEKTFNDYFNKILKTQDVDFVHYVDTDSVVGDTYVYYGDNEIKISELYDIIQNDYVYNDEFNRSYVKPVNDITTKSFNTKLKQLENKNIKHIMKHRVKKEMFKITNHLGESVIVTEDHSVIIKRNGRHISVSPKEINVEIDKIINIV